MNIERNGRTGAVSFGVFPLNTSAKSAVDVEKLRSVSSI